MTTIDIRLEAQKRQERKNPTELVFIVDRSGSMAGLESDTIGGINATLAKNREADEPCNVSIVLFNHKDEVLVDRVDIREVADLTNKDYQVSGCTALLDCMGNAMRHTEKVQGYMPAEYKAAKVIFVVTTDGYENASKDYDYKEIKRMVEQHTEEGWEFLFLGANIDAIEEAGRIGIKASRAATYVPDGRGVELMYECASDAVFQMRCMGVDEELDESWKASIEADTAKRG